MTSTPGHALLAQAAAPAIATVRAITADQLTAPTPCREYDVRGLLNHLLFWGPSLIGAASHTLVTPPAASDREVTLTEDDWADQLVTQIERLATAWGSPKAWEGTTRIAGPDPLPAPMIGGMVLTELVVHSWDLACATGQRPGSDPETLEFVHRELEKTADFGREMGAYGEAVPVASTAPVLDRLLGLAGRDPKWVPVRSGRGSG